MGRDLAAPKVCSFMLVHRMPCQFEERGHGTTWHSMATSYVKQTLSVGHAAARRGRKRIAKKKKKKKKEKTIQHGYHETPVNMLTGGDVLYELPERRLQVSVIAGKPQTTERHTTVFHTRVWPTP